MELYGDYRDALARAYRRKQIADAVGSLLVAGALASLLWWF